MSNTDFNPASPAVTFNYSQFVGAYPTFANCSPAQCAEAFAQACAIQPNNTCTPPFNAGTLPMLLNLLTAHLLWLTAPRDNQGNPAATGKPPPALVGRINTASKGSVSAGVEWQDGGGNPSQPWFLQSQWGALYWQMTAQYRTFRYSPRPTRIGIPGGFRRGGFGF